MALDQEEYMARAGRDDNSLWKPLPGYFRREHRFTAKRAARSERKARPDGGQELLAESSYKGEPVTCVVAQDQPITKAQGDVTAELLKRIGMNVDSSRPTGHDGKAPRARNLRPDKRAGHVPHWPCGRGFVNPTLYRDPCHRRHRLVRSGRMFLRRTEVTAWFDAKNLV